MSERGFFSLRYAVPGYTFILLLIVINHVPLMKLIELTRVEAVFGAFLGFLSLLTGSALGFLVAQFYWLLYERRGGFFTIFGLEKLKNELKKKYDFVDEIKDKQIEHVFDYVFQGLKSKYIHGYTSRRWDVYHTLGATELTLFIGTVVGLVLRLYYQAVLFGLSFSFNEAFPTELCSLALFFSGLVILGISLHWATKCLIFDYAPTVEAFFRKAWMNVKESAFEMELRKVFPEYFRPTSAKNDRRT